jgi:hypothetical protein
MMYPGVTAKKIPIIVFAGIVLLQMIPYMVGGQPPDNFVQDDYQHRVVLYDVNGHPLGSGAVETKGSPYFLASWKLGYIRLADNRVFAGVPLELDLQKQKIHYRRSDGTDIELEPGQVKQLVILDTIAGAQVVYQFVSGFPAVDNQSETSFYLVLDSGKVTLLESMRKELHSEKDELSGDANREYRLYDDFYTFTGGKMTRIKRDAKFFVELTKDKHDQMDDYLKKSKVSFRSAEDIRQFIHYYNGLP